MAILRALSAAAVLVLAAAPVPVLAATPHGRGSVALLPSTSILPTPSPTPTVLAIATLPVTITVNGPTGAVTVDPSPAPVVVVNPTPAPSPLSAPQPTAATPAPATPAPAAQSPNAVAPQAGIATPSPVPVVGVRPVAAAAPAPPDAPPAKPRTSRPEGLGVALLPDILLPPGAEGTRLAIAILAFPLLVASWIWASIRLWLALRRRAAARRLELMAAQVGVSAESLAVLPDAEREALIGNLATDPVTELPLRAPGNALLEREIANAVRQAVPLSLAFVDVDGLKAANDTQGHAAGDRLLRGVADSLRDRLRASDIVYRYAGDEFIVLLPGTGAAAAAELMSELRRLASAAGAPFSYGVAMLEAGETAAALIARADAAQYEDKRARKAERPRTA